MANSSLKQMEPAVNTIELAERLNLGDADDHHAHTATEQNWNDNEFAGNAVASQFWNDMVWSLQSSGSAFWTDGSFEACHSSWPAGWSDIYVPSTADALNMLLPPAEGNSCVPPGLCLPDFLPAAPAADYPSLNCTSSAACDATLAERYGDEAEAAAADAGVDEESPRQMLKTPPGLDLDVVSTEAGDSPSPAVEDEDTIVAHLDKLLLSSNAGAQGKLSLPSEPLPVDADGLKIKLHEILFKDEEMPVVLKLSDFLGEEISSPASSQQSGTCTGESETDGTTLASDRDEGALEKRQQLKPPSRRGQRRGKRGKKVKSAPAAVVAVPAL